MSYANVLSLKTDERLLNVVKKAAQKKMSAAELLEQRVSFVYSSMSDKSGVTKEHVRQVILQQGGAAAK